MARSLTKRMATNGRPISLALPRVALLSPLPPLLLALLVVLSLVAAYAVRPTVRIDLGDYFDSAFVQDFHGREIDATAAGASTPWPQNVNELRVPGRRTGIWIATITAAAGQPDEALDDLALTVNGARVDIPRRPARSLVAIIPEELAAADTIVLRLVPSVEGDALLPLGLAGSVSLAPARTYRWSEGESSITLPGLGRGDWRVDMSLVTANPAGQALNARIVANGMPIATLPEGMNERRVSLLVPATATGSGDLNLLIASNTFTTTADARHLGVFVSDVTAMPAGPRPLLPPPMALVYALVIAGGVYICLTQLTQRAWLAAAAAGALILLGAWAMAAYRFPTSFMLPRLALLAVWSILLLIGLERVAEWLFADRRPETGDRKLGTPDGGLERLGLRSSVFGPQSFVSLLLLIFFISYWVKAGGMLYPYFIGIDVAWHMDRVRWILDGQLPLLYGTNSPLNESTMPLAEWGRQKPVIPYSPYFHIFATSFALLPMPLVLTANMFSALVDSTRLLLIAVLARRGGLSRSATLLAALLYAVIPATYLLHSWGNVPTTFGLWWTLAATTFMFARWNRLHERWTFIGLTLLLLASLLFYTVAAVFMGLFGVVLTVFVLLWGRELRPGLRPLWLAALLALGLSLLIYYGQYIGPIWERTIPYFTRSLTSSNESIGKASDSLSAYLVRHVRLWGYGLVVPLVLSGVYLVWAVVMKDRRPRTEDRVSGIGVSMSGSEFSILGSRLLLLVIASWLTVMVIFIPLAYKVSMVDKHFFVAMPFMALACGAVLDQAVRRGWLLRVATTVFYIAMAAASLGLWLTRIAIVRQ